MKARLVSGEVVSLPKDCNCLTHNTPCWIETDRIDHSINRDRWKEAVDRIGPVTTRVQLWNLQAAAAGHAIEETRRLQTKRAEMDKRGIVELFPEPSDEVTEIQREAIKQHTLRLLAEWEAQRKRDCPWQFPDAEREARAELQERKTEVQVAGRERL